MTWRHLLAALRARVGAAASVLVARHVRPPRWITALAEGDVYPEPGAVHITPRGARALHELTEQCACRPQLELEPRPGAGVPLRFVLHGGTVTRT